MLEVNKISENKAAMITALKKRHFDAEVPLNQVIDLNDTRKKTQSMA